jgi:Flp pilus assembly pilin Flp
MAQYLCNLWREDDGQDLIEYTLLITFIAMACLAFVGNGRTAVRGLWTASNSEITTANVAAS